MNPLEMSPIFCIMGVAMALSLWEAFGDEERWPRSMSLTYLGISLSLLLAAAGLIMVIYSIFLFPESAL